MDILNFMNAYAYELKYYKKKRKVNNKFTNYIIIFYLKHVQYKYENEKVTSYIVRKPKTLNSF